MPSFLTKSPATASARPYMGELSTSEPPPRHEGLHHLAQGFAPAVLTERGLGPALRALAAGAPVRATVLRVPEQRLAPEVEAAAWFVAAEAMANAAKHSGASQVTIDAFADARSLSLSVSDDGRFVTFFSNGAFTIGDAGGDNDIFLRDTKTGQTTRMSVKSNGDEVNVNTNGHQISGNGRFVMFVSTGQFTQGDGGADSDVFVHDRTTGKTELVSVKSNGNDVAGGVGGRRAWAPRSPRSSSCSR